MPWFLRRLKYLAQACSSPETQAGRPSRAGCRLSPDPDQASPVEGAGGAGDGGLADRLGFEPRTALRLYSISSAAPSTGLGHLSRARSLVAALYRALPSPPATPPRPDARPR